MKDIHFSIKYLLYKSNKLYLQGSINFYLSIYWNLAPTSYDDASGFINSGSRE